MRGPCGHLQTQDCMLSHSGFLRTALRRSSCPCPPVRHHRVPMSLPMTVQARRAGLGAQHADPPEDQPAPTAHAVASSPARARAAHAAAEEPRRKRQRTQWPDRAWHHSPSCPYEPMLLAEVRLQSCQAAGGCCCKLLTHVIFSERSQRRCQGPLACVHCSISRT